MLNKMFADLTEQSKQFAEPVNKLNELAVANIEKVAGLQVAAMKEFAELSLDNLKGAASVTNPEEFQAFVSSQQEVANTVSKKVAEDAIELTRLGEEFTAEYQKLLQESVANLTKFNLLQPVK